MRYLIIRHNRGIILGFILLAVLFASAGPWIYENLFIRDQEIMLQERMYQDYDLSSFFAEAEVIKGISSDSTFLNDDYVFSKFRIDNLDIKGIMLSADIVVKGQFIRDDRKGIIGFSGKLFSKDITLNKEPFMGLSMSFRVTGDDLEVRSLRLGRSYELKGRVGLKKPFKTDLRIDIVRADIRDLTILMKAKNPDIAIGVMSGILYVKGDQDILFSKAILESKNGKIGPIRYDLANIRLEGFGPIINIVESNIRHSGSRVTISGYVDLRDIAEGDAFDGIIVRSDMKRLVWDDWDIRREGKDQLSMEKDISDTVRVGFKTMARDPITSYYDEDNPEEISLKYKIGLENIKMRLKEDEEFFGIEHNIKF
ncbi:MAG: hypothetical protein V3S13_00010 [Candidatus Omnitrophota bacterium]